MHHKIAPSVLAADFTNLQKEFDRINGSEADWIHIDVMDGCFVPNISYGQFIVRFMKSMARKPLDVHLMIVQPERYIESFREAGADNITVHFEACPHLHSIVQQIKATGAKAGVALNPHTPVHLLEDILEQLDLVLIMSVNPGFGGQQFIYQTLPKVKKLKEMLVHRNLQTLIEVDGGVGLQNAEKIIQAGADVLVAGSSVFKSDDPVATIARLKSLGEKGVWV
ncbi:MAG TPA: ribulose-phosphate 3-epimerase [Bacteroidetes bacterium]|nr:ribulose-phosphate 3-epimerase [Bacteroidota bacterium]